MRSPLPARGSVRLDAGALFAARVVAALTTLAVLSYVGHRIGPDALGAVGLGFSIGAIAAIVADAGGATLYIREASAAGGRDDTLFTFLSAVRPVTGLAVVAAGWALVDLAVGSFHAVVVLAAAGLVGQQAAELNRAALLARGRAVASGVYSVVENVLWVLVVVGSLAAGAALPVAMALGLVVFLASWLLGLVGLLRWSVVGLRRPHPREYGPLARRQAPFAGFAAAAIVYTRVDTVVVATMAPSAALAAAGAYAAASRLLASIEFLPESLGRALFPRLSRAGDADIRPALVRPLQLVVLLTAPVAAMALLDGRFLMGLLFGGSTEDFAYVLVVLGALLPVKSVITLVLVAITARGRAWARLGVVLVALAVGLTLLLVLVPRHGVPGALVALAVATGVLAATVLYVARADVDVARLVAVLGTAALAGLGCLAVIWPWRGDFPHPLGSLVLAAAYAGLVLLAARLRGQVERRRARAARPY